MKNIFNELLKDKKSLFIKMLILLLFVIILTGSDLLVKQIVETKLKNHIEKVVIPGYWSFRYVQNDDIGFSLLSMINYTGKLKVFLIIQAIGIFIAAGFLLDIKKKTFVKIALMSVIVEIFILALFFALVFISRLYNGSGTDVKWITLVCLQGLGSLVVIAIYIFTKKFKYLIPLALIISGALGNTIDRIIRHYVVDYVMWSFPFIKLDIFNPWPIFNLADVFTVIGACVLFVILMFFSKEELMDKKDIAADVQTPGTDNNKDNSLNNP